jgi:MFS family permease
LRSSVAYREVLRVREARALIGASAVSQLGDWLYNAVLLGYVYEATGSAAWVGAATIFRLAPYVLLGPFGGMLADRYDKRTVLIAGDLLRCALMLALAAVVAADGAVALVIALTSLASAAGSAERPAALALLPRLVGESRLGPANALLHTVQDLGVVLGPAIGAVLLATTADYVAFIVNAGTFAGSAILLSRLRSRAPAAGAEDGTSAFAQLRRGVRSAATTRYVVPLLIVLGMVEFTYGAQTVQLVVYAERSFDVGAAGYGYLLAAVGAGGLLSALVNGRLAASTRASIIVIGTGVLFCATQLA